MDKARVAALRYRPRYAQATAPAHSQRAKWDRICVEWRWFCDFSLPICRTM